MEKQLEEDFTQLKLLKETCQRRHPTVGRKRSVRKTLLKTLLLGNDHRSRKIFQKTLKSSEPAEREKPHHNTRGSRHRHGEEQKTRKIWKTIPSFTCKQKSRRSSRSEVTSTRRHGRHKKKKMQVDYVKCQNANILEKRRKDSTPSPYINLTQTSQEDPIGNNLPEERNSRNLKIRRKMSRSVRSSSSYNTTRSSSSRNRVSYVPLGSQLSVLKGWTTQLMSPRLPESTPHDPTTSATSEGSESGLSRTTRTTPSMHTASDGFVRSGASGGSEAAGRRDDIPSVPEEPEDEMPPEVELDRLLESLGTAEDDAAALQLQRIGMRNGLEGHEKVPHLLEHNEELSRRLEYRMERLWARRQELEEELTRRQVADGSFIVTHQETPERIHEQHFGAPASAKVLAQGDADPQDDEANKKATGTPKPATPTAPAPAQDPDTADKGNPGTKQLVNPGAKLGGGSQPPRPDPATVKPTPPLKPSGARANPQNQGTPSTPKNARGPPRVARNTGNPDQDYLEANPAMTPGENMICAYMNKMFTRKKSPDPHGLRINNFEGKSHEDIEDFLQQWQYWAKARRIEPEMRASQLRGYLGKDVSSRIRALSNEERDDEEEVIEWLRETYGQENEMYYAQKEFASMIQDHKESARNFMDRLKAKWRVAYDGEEANWRTHKRAKETIRDQFIKGLRDSNLAEVMENRTRTLCQENQDDFLKKLAEKTDSEALHQLSKVPPRQMIKKEIPVAPDAKRKETLKAVQGESEQEDQEVYTDQVDCAVEQLVQASNTMCKALGQREFKVREAGPDDTCFGCGKNGHFGRDCPTNPYVPGAQGNTYPNKLGARAYGNYGNRDRTYNKDTSADRMAEAIDKAIEKRLPYMQEMREMVRSNQVLLKGIIGDGKQASGDKVKTVEEKS